MDLKVTDAATKLFLSEWGFETGDQVRIFVRYSGFSESGPYSFGIMKDTPRNPATLTENSGITFYMEQNDSWFLEERELTIDAQNDEIRFVRGS